MAAAAEEESDLGLPMYVDEEEEDPKAAAAKAEREKRKEGGRWGLDKIREKDLERIKEEQAKYPTLPPRRRLDPQAESLAGPMRHLSVTRGGPQLASSANVISVKVSESPIGYPLLVHGAIFVRDEVDCKRVYVFRRDPNNCQTITSKDESLSLTGPSRGLLAFTSLIFEIDLKYKSHRELNEMELGKWFLKDSALTSTSKIVRNRFVGKICAVDLTYAPAHRAVEVTIEAKICEILRIREKTNGQIAEEWLPFNKKMKQYSEFHGKITACINGVAEDVVLYDSNAAGCVISVSDGGRLELMRRVVVVPIDQKVAFKIVSRDGVCVINSSPRICGSSAPERRVGSCKMELKLVWSALYSRNADGSPRCMGMVKL